MKKFFYLLLLIPALALSCEKAESPEETEKSETESVNDPVYTVTRIIDDGQITSRQHSCTIVPGPGGVTLNFSGLLTGEYPMSFEYEVNDGSIYRSSESTMYPSVWINTTYSSSYKLTIEHTCNQGHHREEVFFVNVGQGGKHGKIDHLKTLETDHKKTDQTDHIKTVETDHPKTV